MPDESAADLVGYIRRLRKGEAEAAVPPSETPAAAKDRGSVPFWQRPKKHAFDNPLLASPQRLQDEGERQSNRILNNPDTPFAEKQRRLTAIPAYLQRLKPILGGS